MLDFPWRNESKIIMTSDTYEQQYNAVKGLIFANREQYESNSNILDDALLSLDLEQEETFFNPAPVAQHNYAIDENIGSQLSQTYGCFDPGSNRLHNQYDLYNDFGLFARSNDDEEIQQHRIQDTEYRNLVSSLNKEQKEFFYHVVHSVKTQNAPLYSFLTGGAGVGKSRLTNALFEATTRHYNRQLNANPDYLKVLKLAPTGKAAFNNRGNTIHSALKIPANRGFKYSALDSDKLNTVRNQFKDLKLIIIGEASMVGNGMLNFINLRLQQIKGSKHLFGGISLIAVGDLFQLQPVFDKWVFEDNLDTYGALTGNIWQDNFYMHELSEIMRQRDDKEFAELLNRLPEGNQTERDTEILKTRVLQNNASQLSPDLIEKTHLFATNKTVDYHNSANI